MKYNSKFSKIEATLCLLISFYKLEDVLFFQPIYFQKLLEELKMKNPRAYEKVTDEVGIFENPIEPYLEKILRFEYLKKRDDITYYITMPTKEACKIDENYKNNHPEYYEMVRQVKKSIDSFNINYLEDYVLSGKANNTLIEKNIPIEEQMGQDYCLVMTTEDFLMAFLTQLFSLGEYYFDLDTFEKTFSFSILDNETMKTFLEVSFNHPFALEDMGMLLSKVTGSKLTFSQDHFWLGTMKQNKRMLNMLSLDHKQVIYEMVKKYLEKKKTIQIEPSVVK